MSKWEVKGVHLWFALTIIEYDCMIKTAYNCNSPTRHHVARRKFCTGRKGTQLFIYLTINYLHNAEYSNTPNNVFQVAHGKILDVIFLFFQVGHNVCLRTSWTLIHGLLLTTLTMESFNIMIILIIIIKTFVYSTYFTHGVTPLTCRMTGKNW